jgi:hypothetical protein
VPIVEGTKRAPKAQNTAGGACTPDKFLNLKSISEMPFPGLWQKILHNSGGQKTT